jgi:hypothetical protein
VSLGAFGSNYMAFFVPGALVKFVPPAGQYFLPNGTLTGIASDVTTSYKWSQVAGVTGDGSNSGIGNLSDGTGPVIMTGTIPNGAIPTTVIPKFQSVLSYSLEAEVVNLATSKKNFGLSFDSLTRSWFIVADTNLNLKSSFSLIYQKDIGNVNKDASWLISFEWTGKKYKVRYRTLEYIFESDKETAFFIDNSKKNYDFTTDTVIKDKITVLKNNPAPLDYTPAQLSFNTNSTGSITTVTVVEAGSGYVSTPSIVFTPNNTSAKLYAIINNGSISSVEIATSGTGYSTTTSVISISQPTALPSVSSLGTDYNWQVDGPIIESDGYMEPKKVLISFYDNNEDGQIDDPDTFENIVRTNSVDPQTGFNGSFVYFQTLDDGQRYKFISTSSYIIAYPNEDSVIDKINNQLYYFYDNSADVVKRWNGTTFDLEPSYYAKPGRAELKFHYVHNSGEGRRLDPSKTNIVDVYLLVSSYDQEYRNWLSSGTGTEPLSPTTQSLEENYSSVLEPIKSISDEVVFHPAKYKVLFGSQAVPQLQATFKAVRNPNRYISTTDIQTRILTAIEDFFNIDNWDFGQTFNFSELSTYVMNIMSPDITNFVIVPKMDVSFGSLYQITSQGDEIFVSGATVNDIQVIDSLTASELKATTISSS